jgi:hypothetical protein
MLASLHQCNLHMAREHAFQQLVVLVSAACHACHSAGVHNGQPRCSSMHLGKLSVATNYGHGKHGGTHPGNFATYKAAGIAERRQGELTGSVMMSPDSGHRKSSGRSPRTPACGERSGDAMSTPAGLALLTTTQMHSASMRGMSH